jgi:signal transduction histidine kinase
VYANLSPGRYRFEVRAQTKYGVTNSVLASMNLRLRPAFYQTGWFVAGIVALGLAVAAGLYRWRLHYLRAIHRLQQETAIAVERSRIARDLHDGLGANLTRLSLLVDQAEQQAAEPQALSERLAKLGASARETLRSLRDAIWTAQPDQDTLDSLVTRICQHAEDLFAPAGVACRFDRDNLPRDRVLPATVRHHVFYAAREAMNNVARHAGATAVWIRAEVGNRQFTLRIEDNGCGLGTGTDPMPEARLQTAGSGRGLPNLRTRIEALGGRFAIESPEGGGTCVVFEIPL